MRMIFAFPPRSSSLIFRAISAAFTLSRLVESVPFQQYIVFPSSKMNTSPWFNDSYVSSTYRGMWKKNLIQMAMVGSEKYLTNLMESKKGAKKISIIQKDALKVDIPGRKKIDSRLLETIPVRFECFVSL